MTVGALSGIRILDFTHVLSGPYCTMVLGDLGAEVIKVEPKVGDETRNSRLRKNDFSVQFGIVNRNKKSVAIDLSKPEGRDAVKRIASTCDVIVENFRPGAMTRLGLDYTQLSAEIPDLIYCSISGFGADGPNRLRGGFDIIAQGESGALSVTGTADGQLTKLGVPASDIGSGLYACLTIAASLYRRQQTGKGEYIDIGLVDSLMSFLVWEASQIWSGGVTPSPLGTGNRSRTPYQVFEASDGPFIVGAGNEATWLKLCKAIDAEYMILDPRFKTNADRMANHVELVSQLQSLFKGKTAKDWIQTLEATGCPVGLILNVREAFESDHAISRGMTLEMDNPNGGTINSIGFPYHLMQAPAALTRRPPTLGEHNHEVLTQLAGYSDDEVETMAINDVIYADDRK